MKAGTRFYVRNSGSFTYRLPGEEDWDLPVDARPLVVIDPEDREQVGRLIDLLAMFEAEMRRDYIEPQAGVMQAALREFANPKPPKPDEPEAEGAIVQREDGTRWVRGPKGWTNLDASGRFLNWSNWSEVNEFSTVAKVLSPGVPVE